MASDPASQPLTDTPGQTAYDQYVRTLELHRLQHTLTEEPAELSFLVISQVMELYFALITAEWRLAIAGLDEGREDDAIDALRRSVFHFGALNASWASLRWMTPMEFNRFREHLGIASGFQSWAYRHMEFMVGLKNRALIGVYEENPVVHQGLVATLEAPSLYDAALQRLDRSGLRIAPEHLARDLTKPYAPHESVEAAWIAVYTGTDRHSHLRLLADCLSDIAEAFHEWRLLHLQAVRRSLGAKQGSGGSSGIEWLERSLSRPIFDELWSARTAV